MRVSKFVPNPRFNVTPSHRFWVEIDGMLVGGFTEVSGLSAETELEEYAEGGVNDRVHYLPKRTKYPKIVLKRGITVMSDLWLWYENTLNGKPKRKSGAVVMQDQSGTEIVRWNFYDAYPSKYSASTLNATSNEMAVESMEIAHGGVKVEYSKTALLKAVAQKGLSAF